MPHEDPNPPPDSVDEATLCLVNTPGERPKTFDSSVDQPTTVWIFKRVKSKD